MNKPTNSLYSGWCSNQWWSLVSQSADDPRQEPRVSIDEIVSLTDDAPSRRGRMVA